MRQNNLKLIINKSKTNGLLLLSRESCTPLTNYYGKLFGGGIFDLNYFSLHCMA